MSVPTVPVPYELEVYGVCAGPDNWHSMGQPVIKEAESKDESYFYWWEWIVPMDMCLIHSRIRTNGHTQHSEIEKTFPIQVFKGNRFVVTLPVLGAI